MKRYAKILAAVTLASSALVGCASNTYKAAATDTQMAAYAGQAVYPDQMKSELAIHMFASVANDATITLYNAGDEPYTNFELWVNHLYTLHVDKFDARNVMAIDPATLYNKTGANIKGVPANSISTIQILANGKLWDVQGPIIAH